MQLPPFSSLPIDPKGPPFNAWGLWGQDDQLGRANLISPESVKRGRDAIQHGCVINLNLPLDVEPMNARRTRLKHEIIRAPTCNDDTLAFNTQTSTQWDGLRHYGYQDWPDNGVQTYYGGMTTAQATDKRRPRCGTENLVQHPLTSRGVLLDMPRYLAARSLAPLSPLDDTTPITAMMLQGCAEYEQVSLQPGDILCVRTGWSEAFNALPKEEQVSHRNQGVGVARGEDTLRWHWESGVAAVASDVRAYESFPHENCGLSLHEVFLGGWGMSIGELFDLEELGRKCAELRQWTFLFTSMPLNIGGGVASPPSAQAIM